MYTPNDKQLRKSVQAFTRMLNENEWAEHAGHGDPDSSALETAITDLHNDLAAANERIAELEKDAARYMHALAELCDQLTAMRYSMFLHPSGGQHYSYLDRDDVYAHVEEARKAFLKPQQPNDA